MPSSAGTAAAAGAGSAPSVTSVSGSSCAAAAALKATAIPTDQASARLLSLFILPTPLAKPRPIPANRAALGTNGQLHHDLSDEAHHLIGEGPGQAAHPQDHPDAEQGDGRSPQRLAEVEVVGHPGA